MAGGEVLKAHTIFVVMSSKPHFLIVGVPKAGTTSLYNYLKAHPDIYMPATTELRYFNADEMLNNLNGHGDEIAKDKICNNRDSYESFFKGVSNEKVIGECTTSYLYSRATLASIKQKLGSHVKLIVMLREPVSRAFSNYIYYVRRDREQVSFEEAIQLESERAEAGWNNGWFHLGHSLYADKIKNLIDSGLTYKVVFFEDLKGNPLKIVTELYEFLGVDSGFKPENLDITYNKGGVYKNKALINWMLKPSGFRRVIKAILPTKLIDGLRISRDKFISNQTKPIKINPKTASELKEYFRSDVEELAKLISFDKSKWGY